MNDIATDVIKYTDFGARLDLIMAGKIEMPNFKEVPLEEGVAAIAAGAGFNEPGGVRNAKVPGSPSSWGHWARYFLGTTQGGSFDGTGYVMWWQQSKGHIGTFAICVHSHTELAGANHSRGWHPSRCAKCGLDTSVDSGD